MTKEEKRLRDRTRRQLKRVIAERVRALGWFDYRGEPYIISRGGNWRCCVRTEDGGVTDVQVMDAMGIERAALEILNYREDYERESLDYHRRELEALEARLNGKEAA